MGAELLESIPVFLMRPQAIQVDSNGSHYGATGSMRQSWVRLEFVKNASPEPTAKPELG